MSQHVICTNLNGEKFEVSSDKLFFRPSVYGVIIVDNKVLLSKQWDGYDFPGGGQDIHETIEDALKREVWEETGYKVEQGDYVFFQEGFYKKLTSEVYFHSLLMYYTATIISGEPSIDNIDPEETSYIDMPEWIPLDEIDNLKFYNQIDSVALIKAVAAGKTLL